MPVLVFVESDEGKVRKTSLEAVAYAKGLGEPVTALIVGDQVSQEDLASLGKFGATRVLHAADSRLNSGIIQAYAEVIAQAMDSEKANTLVLANTSLGTPAASRVAAKTGAALVTNVVESPNTSNGFIVKKSIYTGKAFAYVSVTSEKRILAIRKNAATATEGSGTAEVIEFNPTLSDASFSTRVLNVEKAKGDVLLPEAEIVVSGGRGMKGPENWGMLEALAKVLGAATGCSKPVSDMGWRPHHEHVGQTGIKVSPQLYIAIGISGAIQHLAGVNTSRYILVINKDPEAPFFKAADYGVVGDAFEVVPRLTEAIKAIK